ncbi:hypothetical protein CRI94_08240 [Longibacter salinarum]|uniref:Uncharacterized protein n=1 Tax=Longibacter salinarum TaxID=1850348 RepID=A0A2A8CZB6_9BACT|nr:hypothetical protein [Longibacter salinarum]PEN14025.1 hypothetical protein CRI94_08240 [Longibacter salinarum]
MSKRASKMFVVGAFVFIFGLGTVGAFLLVDVAETALDQSPAAQDSTQTATPDSLARISPDPSGTDSLPGQPK